MKNILILVVMVLVAQTIRAEDECLASFESNDRNSGKTLVSHDESQRDVAISK